MFTIDDDLKHVMRPQAVESSNVQTHIITAYRCTAVTKDEEDMHQRERLTYTLHNYLLK